VQLAIACQLRKPRRVVRQSFRGTPTIGVHTERVNGIPRWLLALAFVPFWACACGKSSKEPQDEPTHSGKKDARAPRTSKGDAASDAAADAAAATDSGSTAVDARSPVEVADGGLDGSLDASSPDGLDAGPSASDARSDAGTETAPQWQLLADLPEAALLGVHGQSADDVWMVGADDGNGPMILHFDGQGWQRLVAQLPGVDLWWVRTLSDGAVLMSGSASTVLLYEGERLVHLQPPGSREDRVWGVWGESSSEIYAVGSSEVAGGFIWHYANGTWEVVALPGAALARAQPPPGMFKVWGAAPDDVWIVGDVGTVLRGNAADGFELIESNVDGQLIGIHGNTDHVWIAGGRRTGVLLEWTEGRRLINLARTDVPVLQGVSVEGRAQGWVTGYTGVIYRVDGARWELIDTGYDIWPETLHSLWQDPDGGVWTVGGNVFSDLGGGLALYFGPPIVPYTP
jgi:hypothetical protein